MGTRARLPPCLADVLGAGDPGPRGWALPCLTRSPGALTVNLGIIRGGGEELSLTLDEQPRETVTDTSSQQQQQPQQNNQYYGWPFGGFFS